MENKLSTTKARLFLFHLTFKLSRFGPGFNRSITWKINKTKIFVNHSLIFEIIFKLFYFIYSLLTRLFCTLNLNKCFLLLVNTIFILYGHLKTFVCVILFFKYLLDVKCRNYFPAPVYCLISIFYHYFCIT